MQSPMSKAIPLTLLGLKTASSHIAATIVGSGTPVSSKPSPGVGLSRNAPIDAGGLAAKLSHSPWGNILGAPLVIADSSLEEQEKN